MSKHHSQKKKIKVYQDWLCKKFPECFNDSFRPLSVGVFAELAEQLPEDISKTKLNHSIHWYTTRIEYYEAFSHHAFRVNPDGSDAEEISVRDKVDAELNLIMTYMKKTEYDRLHFEERERKKADARNTFLKEITQKKRLKN